MMMISDVKQTVHHLNHNDMGVSNFVRASIPAELYGTLYLTDNLNVTIVLVKVNYAKIPEQKSGPSTTSFFNTETRRE